MASPSFLPANGTRERVDRLRERVAAQPLGVRLTLLHGTTGQGKTVLLDSLQERLAEDGTNVVRFSLRGARDPQEVWRVFAKAVRGETDARKRVEQSTEDSRLSVDTWAQSISEPVVLLVDSYEDATSPQTDVGLAKFLEGYPLLRAVVASRAFAVLDGPAVASRIPTVTFDVDE